MVTDDAARLKEQLEQVTGDRIAALEGIGGAALDSAGNTETRGKIAEALPDREMEPEPARVSDTAIDATKPVEREQQIEMEL